MRGMKASVLLAVLSAVISLQAKDSCTKEV